MNISLCIHISNASTTNITFSKYRNYPLIYQSVNINTSKTAIDLYDYPLYSNIVGVHQNITSYTGSSNYLLAYPVPTIHNWNPPTIYRNIRGLKFYSDAGAYRATDIRLSNESITDSMVYYMVTYEGQIGDSFPTDKDHGDFQIRLSSNSTFGYGNYLTQLVFTFDSSYNSSLSMFQYNITVANITDTYILAPYALQSVFIEIDYHYGSDTNISIQYLDPSDPYTLSTNYIITKTYGAGGLGKGLSLIVSTNTVCEPILSLIDWTQAPGYYYHRFIDQETISHYYYYFANNYQIDIQLTGFTDVETYNITSVNIQLIYSDIYHVSLFVYNSSSQYWSVAPDPTNFWSNNMIYYTNNSVRYRLEVYSDYSTNIIYTESITVYYDYTLKTSGTYSETILVLSSFITLVTITLIPSALLGIIIEEKFNSPKYRRLTFVMALVIISFGAFFTGNLNVLVIIVLLIILIHVLLKNLQRVEAD